MHVYVSHGPNRRAQLTQYMYLQIGYRMAVVEMKVLIFEIIRTFDIALPSLAPEIIRKPKYVPLIHLINVIALLILS